VLGRLGCAQARAAEIVPPRRRGLRRGSSGRDAPGLEVPRPVPPRDDGLVQ